MISTYISVALLIGLVLVIRRPFARAFGAKAAYALWALPLARLVMPPLPHWMSPRNWLMSGETAGDTAASRAFIPHDAVMSGPPVPSLKPDIVSVTATPAPVEPAQSWVFETAEPATSSVFSLPSLALVASLLIAIVLIGALGIIARQAWAQMTFSRLIRYDSTPAEGRLAALAAMVQREVGLRRDVPVRTSLLCGAPLVTGVLRPVILVPSWFEEDYTPEEQRIALTHEAMHVKRGDLLALQLAHLMVAFQWINPLAWRAMDAFRADQEAACDADVLALNTTSPRSYGATLLKAIRQSRPHSAPAFAAALPLNHSIKDRFAMLQADTPTRPRKRLALALTLSAGTAAMLATASTVSADEPDLEGGERYTKEFIYRSDSDGRQMVLLTNPMAEFEVHMSQLDAIEWPTPPEPPLPPMPPMELDMDLDFSALEELQIELQNLHGIRHLIELNLDSNVTHLDGKQIIELSQDGASIRMEIDEEMFEELEARIEEQAARIEEQAELIEEEAERWAEQFEAEYEVHFEAFEAEMEAVAARVEAITDSDEFEELMESGTLAIEELQEACDDVDFDGVDVAVVESGSGDKAVCIDRTRADLSDETILAAVMSDPNLTEAEKEAFVKNRNQNVRITIHRDEQRSDRHRDRDRDSELED